MTRTSIAHGALKWAYSNALIEASLGPLGRGRVIRERYEDVVRDPRTALGRLAAHAGQPRAVIPFDGDGTIDLGPTHTVWGNPNRLKTGPLRLQGDVEWETGMPATQRATVTAITWPLLIRYGYPLWIR